MTEFGESDLNTQSGSCRDRWSIHPLMKNGSEHSSPEVRASLTQVCKAKEQEGRFSVWERVSGRVAGPEQAGKRQDCQGWL